MSGENKRQVRSFIRRVALAGLAGLAGASSIAGADDCCRWELRVQRKAVLSDTFTVELWAHFPDSGYAFQDGILSIRSDGVLWTASEFCGSASRHGVGGGIGSKDVLELHAFYDHLGGLPPDTANPIRVWCGEFESQCEDPWYRQIWTETAYSGGTTPFYTYFADPPGVNPVICAPLESHRTVFCGPIVVGGWLAAPSAGTKAEIVGDTLVLAPERLGGDIGASVGDERIDWSKPAVFGAEIDVGKMPSGATLDLTWFPWVNCWIIPDPSITFAATKKGEDLVIRPDFTRAGISTVPVRALRDGKVVGEGILPTGASFGLHPLCSSLSWCYELNQFDQLVLVLKCDDWFELSLPGQPRIQVDRVELAPRGVQGAFGGVDRLELKTGGVEKLVVLDVGDLSGGACYADCDESGSLDFFDFLCFQNQFAAGEPAADCDDSGKLDFFDFLCFQDAFAAACP